MAVINGTGDDDLLTGTDGDDILRGLSGDDTLDGGKGADALYGASGDDIYIVDNAGDTVNETSTGVDTVKTSLLTYTLGANVENLTATKSGNRFFTGNDLNNTIIGGTRDDQLFGGAGDDVLDGRGGRDIYDGGDGFDRAILNYGQASAGLYFESGIGYIGNEEVTQLVGIEAVTLTGTRYGDDIRVEGSGSIINGGGGGDFISDYGGDNNINGGDGDDLIHDIGGVDVLNGGRGGNFLELYRWNVTIDLTLVYNPASGKLNQLQDGTTFKNFDGLYLETGSGDDYLDGHLSASTIWLHGHGGDDTLIGSNAGDYLLGYAGNDVIEGRGGGDLLRGGNGDDVLNGGDGGDSLDGEGGADVLNGGAGDDGFSFGTDLGDTIDGGTGREELDLDVSASVEDVILSVQFGAGIVNHLVGGTSFTNIEVLRLRTGAGDDDITFMQLPTGHHSWDGGGGSDHGIIDLSAYTTPVVFTRVGSTVLDVSVNGGDGTLHLSRIKIFTITGGSGADRITGGIRADEFTGGGGNDVFTFAAGSGRDKIFDFTDGHDKIDVSGFGYHSLAEMTAAGGEYHGDSDTLITFNTAGDSVRLENFLPANLTSADFIFA
ncbi:hypothetical protein D3874_10455 [Oleomonas cavernae]|uniref:Calcium-binding protein n=1 Tax=Oleomonas cavernae TaxID=2320859 RepID=A0A418WBL5_9PROT|nr:hypothetical protein [Oleomonas cavernae]RJF87390.1 hypothetical protein D3874_10455 [Oleomonas cavernae]